LYSIKHGVAFDEAKKFVTSEYGKVGRERLEWYDISYWIRKLDLDVSPEQVLESYQQRIGVFPEVTGVLDMLKHMGLRLIIVTNARREFVDLEIKKTKIGPYFEQVFSATSDFGLIKNAPDIYEKVCTICKVTPKEMIHVGDDRRFDFEVPRELDIEAFYLDRTGKHSGAFVIHSLTELSPKLTAGTPRSEQKNSSRR
jgi:HAD superfamily hydrolase (TIGR01549 family)